MFKTKMKTCERCRLTGLDPDELSLNSKGEMWCNICWEQIADLRNRKEKEYEVQGREQVDEMLRENIKIQSKNQIE